MRLNKYRKRAIKYRVEDIKSALIPGGRLFNILSKLESGAPLSDYAHDFLRSKGLLALSHYATHLQEFTKAAKSEQAKRCPKIDTEPPYPSTQVKQKLKVNTLQPKLKQVRKREGVERKSPRNPMKEIQRQGKNNPRKTTKAVQTDSRAKSSFSNLAKVNFPHAFEIDPGLKKKALQARKQAKTKKKKSELEQKYGLTSFINNADVPKLKDILRRVDNSERLSEKEFAWLKTKRYFTTTLKEKYHRNEAAFYAGQFKKKRKDYWLAVNASSHYRKCNQAQKADSLLSTIDTAHLKNVKLKSALFTTHGGTKRDLDKPDEALDFGKQAHLLTPKDFRPCTLLGAVNIEMGHYDLGRSWYDKAIKRGYSERAMDDDLRTIFMRAGKSKQENLREYLLKLDHVRYSWARKKQGRKSHKR
jgi:hypothetical protein